MNCKKSLSPLLLKAVCVTVAALMQYFLMARFLLDARHGNPSLPVCCESFQHQHQDAHVSRHFMGYFDFSAGFIIYC